MPHSTSSYPVEVAANENIAHHDSCTKGTKPSIRQNLDFFLFCVSFGSSLPITVAARSRALNVFARSDTGIVGSNPTQGMGVFVRLFCVCAVVCADSGLATG
jgi:hypothetical protein